MRLVVRLWESQRECAKLLAELGVSVTELCQLFGASDSATRDALNGQRASAGFRDLTGGCTRLPRMSKQEYEQIVVLAERQLRQHPTLTGPFDKLCRLLVACYETEAFDRSEPVAFESGASGVLDRIADAYVSLGEQLFKLVRELRSEHLEETVVEVLDGMLDQRVTACIERYFA